MRTLSQINKEYEDIIHGIVNEPYRSSKLASFMDEMEGSFKVPGARNEAWESDKKPIIALYRKISLSKEL